MVNKGLCVQKKFSFEMAAACRRYYRGWANKVSLLIFAIISSRPIATHIIYYYLLRK